MNPIFITTVSVARGPHSTFEEAIERLNQHYVGKMLTEPTLRAIKHEVSELSKFYFGYPKFEARLVGFSIEVVPRAFINLSPTSPK